MADVELAECPVFCPAKAGGDHDHVEPPFIPGWMPYEVMPDTSDQDDFS